jgi:hypothetical protein
MSMPRRERFSLNDPWWEPSNIMWWGFLGGIAVGAVGFVLGPTSDFGPLFLLLAMVMWTVALLAMVVFYIGEAWSAFRSTRQQADDALRLAERIGEVPSLRRAAWSYALWSRSYERYGRRTRGLLSAGGLLILLFLALGGLGVRQLALNPAIEQFARAQSCGYQAATTPSENCKWTGKSTVVERVEHFALRLNTHSLVLRMPEGGKKAADLGFQDLPDAKPGDVVDAQIWRGQVTEVDGYGSYIWTGANPNQQRINTWEWMGAVIVVILLALGVVFYRYRQALGGAIYEPAA